MVRRYTTRISDRSPITQNVQVTYHAEPRSPCFPTRSALAVVERDQATQLVWNPRTAKPFLVHFVHGRVHHPPLFIGEGFGLVAYLLAGRLIVLALVSE